MARSNFGYRTVKLDKVKQNNIVLLDYSDNVSESVFEQEYKKASRIIQSIIEDNRTKIPDRSKSGLANMEDCCPPCKNRRNRSVNLTEFHTAVPFIGDRGTGKTSVMRSILDHLKCYTGETPSAAFYLGSKNDSIRFITFDMIDANTLKCTEDVMEIILARMLAYLEDIQYDVRMKSDMDDSHADCSFRELYRQIDELHEDLSLVYWKKPDMRDEYGLTGLQRIADSQKAIASFRKLVETFTKDIGRYLFGGKTCFLVLALDDIDMYQGSSNGMQDSQFALLEHIYSYMRIPGLIVLMTYNERVLKRKCDSHFERLYFGDQKLKEYTQTEREDIANLTAQFMSKLFPQEQRIYLPNYMFIDSANLPSLYVTPMLTDTNGKPSIIPPFSSEDALPVKEFMLRLIAHKTGVYFDAAGTKKHFFEPRNLRELGELFQVIYSLEAIPSADGSDHEAVKRRNRQELLSYLYNQFALKKLDTKEYKQFQRLAMLPLVRQDRTLVDMIRQQRLAVATKPDDFGYLTKTKRDRWKYSYGELLHNIYFSTRISKSSIEDETYFSKEFIHCILGTHSVVMTQTMGMPGARSTILGVIGSSIAGRWANEMLPDLYLDARDAVSVAGSGSLPVRAFFDWKIPWHVQQAIFQLCTEENAEAHRILRQFMEAFIVAGMLFTGFPSNGLRISLEADLDSDGEANLYLRSASEDHICFNVFNFAINLYQALPAEPSTEKQVASSEGYLSYIHKKLEKLGKYLSSQLGEDWGYHLEKSIKQKQAAKDRVTQLLKKIVAYNDLDAGHRLARAREQAADQAYAWVSLLLHQNAQEDDAVWSALNHIEQQYFETIEQMDGFDPQAAQSAMHEKYIAIAHLWHELKQMRTIKFDSARFESEWNKILQGILRKYKSNVRAWQDKHTSFQLTLPVQNFDMMYNIVKRLASVSYHDIPEAVSVDEVYDYYVLLYKSVAEELRAQDNVYFENGENGFAEAFETSLFYKIVTASKIDKEYNPYLKDVIVSMIRSSAKRRTTRNEAPSIDRW